MDTTTLDFNTLALLVTLLVAIMGSTLTIITLMFRQFNQLDTKIGNLDTRVGGLDTKIGNLDTRVTGLENTVTTLDGKFDTLKTRFDALDGKVDALDGKVDALDGKFDHMGRDVSDARERLARIEGHLMAPEGFRMRGAHPPAPDQPSTEDPNPDHRQAG